MDKLKRYISTENIAGIIFFIFVFTLPFYSNAYKIQNFANFYVTVLLALSLCLVWGYSGIFSFGQAAFMGIGAYTYSITIIASENTVLAIIMAIVVPLLAALLIGYFIFYGGIGDNFVALITLCIATALETFMIQTSDSKWKIAGVALGGYNGINSVPSMHFGDIKIKGELYYFVMVFIILTVYLFLKATAHSSWGYALFGVRENKERSAMFGYNTRFLQTSVFAASGALAGLAGCLFSAGQNYVVPTTCGTDSSILAIVMVATAGRKNPTAVVILTLFYSWFSQRLAGNGAVYGDLLLGAILVIVVLFIPDGVLATGFEKIDECIAGLKKKALSK